MRPFIRGDGYGGAVNGERGASNATQPAAKASACTADKSAVVLAAGPVVCVSDTEAEAGNFFHRSDGRNEPSRRVVKKESGWVSLGPTWKYDPL
jgi:hypothetical protein